MKGFLGKFSGEQRKELGEEYGVVWEKGMK